MRRRRTCVTAGHRADRHQKYIHYDVYDAEDNPIAIDATGPEAARAMGIRMSSFYATISRIKSGVNAPKKWFILRRYLDEEEEDDEQ